VVLRERGFLIRWNENLGGKVDEVKRVLLCQRNTFIRNRIRLPKFSAKRKT